MRGASASEEEHAEVPAPPDAAAAGRRTRMQLQRVEPMRVAQQEQSEEEEERSSDDQASELSQESDSDSDSDFGEGTSHPEGRPRSGGAVKGLGRGTGPSQGLGTRPGQQFTAAAAGFDPLAPLPPPASEVLIPIKDAPPLVMPAAAFAHLVSAYNIMRAFSWQLRLSPFPIEVRSLSQAPGSPTRNSTHSYYTPGLLLPLSTPQPDIFVSPVHAYTQQGVACGRCIAMARQFLGCNPTLLTS